MNTFKLDPTVKAEFMTTLGGRIKNRAWRMHSKSTVHYLKPPALPALTNVDIFKVKLKNYRQVKGSSWVKGVAYDKERLTMTLITINGVMYSYENIMPFLWQDVRKVIKDEGSVGKWVNDNLKGMYKSTKIG